jgi:hypothetical protein
MPMATPGTCKRFISLRISLVIATKFESVVLDDIVFMP